MENNGASNLDDSKQKKMQCNSFSNVRRRFFCFVEEKLPLKINSKKYAYVSELSNNCLQIDDDKECWGGRGRGVVSVVKYSNR